MSVLSMVEVASFAAPRRRHRAVMVLHAFFDESGTHASAPASDIAGFIGTPEEWGRVEKEWGDYLDSKGIAEWHYWEFEERKGPWVKMERWERDPIRAHLVTMLADSALIPLNAGYRGTWRPETFADVSPDRYPSSYSFCFELMMEIANVCSAEVFGGEPIAVMFAHHPEYTSRAEEFFHLFKSNSLWERFVSPIMFDSPTNRDALQCADMIAYECYQCLKAGTGTGYGKWPLVTALWDGKADGIPKSKYVVFHDEETLPEVFKRPTHRLRRPGQAIFSITDPNAPSPW